MKELLRTSNLVSISYIQACLAERGIESVVLDAHTSTYYGGTFIKRRVMVSTEDYEAALRILNEQKAHFDTID